jgi:uncharacterized protein YfaS (alpha-2-macroglobulin family)
MLVARLAWAEDSTTGTLHVLRPIIRADQEKAEMCLEFDHELNGFDRADLKLESKGKPVATVKGANIQGNVLCIPELEHGHDYHIAVNNIRGTMGEKLAAPYSLRFTISDKPPSLTFLNMSDGFVRGQDTAPTLRGTNVPQAHIELYELKDRQAMLMAWHQRRQTSLVPTESALFAQDHGQKIWAGEWESTGSTRDGIAEGKLDLPKDPATGLFLVVAESHAVVSNKDALPPTSAVWLLRSNLNVTAVHDNHRVYAMVHNIVDMSVAVKVEVAIYDAADKKIAGGKTNDDGVAIIELNDEAMKGISTIIVQDDKGHVAFADCGNKIVGNAGSVPEDVRLVPDRKFYRPGETVSVNIDSHNQSKTVTDSNLFVLWPDGNFFRRLSVATDAAGKRHIDFDAPPQNGEWQLRLKSAEGKDIAAQTLRVTTNAEAPRFEISSERSILLPNDAATIIVRSLTYDGKPMPNMPGKIFIRHDGSHPVLPRWKDYIFDNGGLAAQSPIASVNFTTDDQGLASIPITPPKTEESSQLYNLALQARGNNLAGIANSSQITLSIWPSPILVGVRALAANARFPENSRARFSVIAVNANEKLQNTQNFSYRIYQEGRSFDWFQSDGRWDYKPQPQSRRLSGGTLNLSDSHETIIEWPVTAGTYRLDILNAEGVVQTSLHFSAGWSAESSVIQSRLSLMADTTGWVADKETRIRFHLDNKSIVTAIVSDGNVRKIIHQVMDAGDNSFSFTPETKWGDVLHIHIEASDGAGNMDLRRIRPDILLKDDEHSTTGAIRTFSIPETLKSTDSTRVFVDIGNDSDAPAVDHVSLAASAPLKIKGASEVIVKLDAHQTKRVFYTLGAVRPGLATVRFDVTRASHKHEGRDGKIVILPPAQDIHTDGNAVLDPKKIWTATPNKKHGMGAIFISPRPLGNALDILPVLLRANPESAEETAFMIEVIRRWKDVLQDSGFVPSYAVDWRIHNLELRLLAQQNSDGSFSSAKGDADITQTSAAVRALARSESQLVKPSLDLAVEWLRHRLDNTWIDDLERAARPVAYRALLEAGKLDNANLHYFAESSVDKNLPPDSAARLALVFAGIGDKDLTNRWVTKIDLPKNLPEFDLRTFYLLAMNEAIDPQIWLSAFEAMAQKADRLMDKLGILQTIAALQMREGNWNVTINTDRRNPKGILAMAVSDKSPMPVVHNTGDKPQTLTTAHFEKAH